MIKRNGFLVMVIFFLVLSLLLNVYTLRGSDKENSGEKEKNIALNEELKSKEVEIKKYKEMNNNNSTNDDNDNNDGNNDSEQENKEVENEVEKNVEKFIEYAFSNNAEDYTTRKKLAKNYMTDDLYETIFSSDGLNEEQKLIISVEDIEVFQSYEDDEILIVRYIINESKIDEEYEESFIKYSKIELDGNKVHQIKPLTLDDWGI